LQSVRRVMEDRPEGVGVLDLSGGVRLAGGLDGLECLADSGVVVQVTPALSRACGTEVVRRSIGFVGGLRGREGEGPLDEDAGQMDRFGGSSPGSTSSSTSAIVMRPAMAASGLKLVAALLKTRLP
jgi:hypothetical protein